MRTLHPARDEMQARKVREAIELCGKNRGPHDYIPIEWMYSQKEGEPEFKRITRFLCRVCFNTVNTATLLQMYDDVSAPESGDSSR